MITQTSPFKPTVSQDDRQRVARAAETAFIEIVTDIENKHALSMPHLKSIQYLIDQPIQWGSTDQTPYHRKFHGLRSQPYWKLEDFSARTRRNMKKFVRDFPALKREFQIANKTNRFVDGHTGFHGTLSDWRQRVILNQNMSFTEDAVSSFPHLCKLLQPFVRTKVARRSYFAMMRAGSQLTNHCGGTNLFLRLHLAVEIPQGDIGLVVGGELRRWREGELILFDDSFGHEAWNRSGRDRYIFLIRILHPDILDIERSWLPRIFKRFEATAASKAVFQMFQDKNLK